MRNGARLVLVLGLVAAGCGNESTGRTRDRPEDAGASPAAQSPSPSGSTAPTEIRVARLPARGIAVDERGGVALVRLDGHVVDHLAGFDLSFEWTVPGEVILGTHDTYYVLRPESHVLERLASEKAASLLVPQFQDGVDPIAENYLDLARPSEAPDDAGFWVYALRSPDGSMLLGQWTGECEVPMSFFLSATGSDPRPVIGGPEFIDIPNTRALGWTPDDDAVVHVMDGACGLGHRAGVYVIDPAGGAELVVHVSSTGGARMWGAA
jgi:hypothetical protein